MPITNTKDKDTPGRQKKASVVSFFQDQHEDESTSLQLHRDEVSHHPSLADLMTNPVSTPSELFRGFDLLSETHSFSIRPTTISEFRKDRSRECIPTFCHFRGFQDSNPGAPFYKVGKINRIFSTRQFHLNFCKDTKFIVCMRNFHENMLKIKIFSPRIESQRKKSGIDDPSFSSLFSVTVFASHKNKYEVLNSKGSRIFLGMETKDLDIREQGCWFGARQIKPFNILVMNFIGAEVMRIEGEPGFCGGGKVMISLSRPYLIFGLILGLYFCARIRVTAYPYNNK